MVIGYKNKYEDTTIEKYLVSLKIERVKELLVYDKKR